VARGARSHLRGRKRSERVPLSPATRATLLGGWTRGRAAERPAPLSYGLRRPGDGFKAAIPCDRGALGCRLAGPVARNPGRSPNLPTASGAREVGTRRTPRRSTWQGQLFEPGQLRRRPPPRTVRPTPGRPLPPPERRSGACYRRPSAARCCSARGSARFGRRGAALLLTRKRLAGIRDRGHQEGPKQRAGLRRSRKSAAGGRPSVRSLGPARAQRSVPVARVPRFGCSPKRPDVGDALQRPSSRKEIDRPIRRGPADGMRCSQPRQGRA
jgi:hypothetical protein